MILPLLPLILLSVVLAGAASVQDLAPATLLLALAAGSIVGFSLGLMGGGGSIISVPMLLYIVGIDDVHIAVGTSALAVGVVAAINAYAHKSRSNLDLKAGLLFALTGVPGAYLGARLGEITPGNYLMLLFAALMIAVGAKMLLDSWKTRQGRNEAASIGGAVLHSMLRKQSPLVPLSIFGLAVGFAAGFFGIGGGFMVVPSLIYSAQMTMAQAVGTSLVPTSAFGLTSASSYLAAGHVDLGIAAALIAGGIGGGLAGARYSDRVKNHQLVRIFALALVAVAIYVTYRGLI